MPVHSFAVRLPSLARNPPNSEEVREPFIQHGTVLQIISYLAPTHCRWRLPFWLIFFGVTVSIYTLLFLLTGTVYPVPGRWTRYNPHSLGALNFASGIYQPGHLPSAVNGSTSHPLAPASDVEPGHVFVQLTRSGATTILSTTPRRPSTSGPASLVDNSLSLLVQVRIPDAPRDARCSVTSGITLTRHLETTGRAARVHLWSLEDNMSTLDENYWPRHEAHVSSFDVRPGETPVQRSTEFACPPSQSLLTFKVSCADGDDACSVDVWQGLFRVEIRA